MNIEQAFATAERRAFKLRVTLPEVAMSIDMSRTTLWRAMTGAHKRVASSLRVLRDIEARLDAIEAERAAK